MPAGMAAQGDRPGPVRACGSPAKGACHPDVMQARGLPAEAVRLADRRLVAINAAWAEISGKVAA